MALDNLRDRINKSKGAAEFAESSARVKDAQERFDDTLRASKNARSGVSGTVHIPQDRRRKTQRSTTVPRSDFR